MNKLSTGIIQSNTPPVKQRKSLIFVASSLYLLCTDRYYEDKLETIRNLFTGCNVVEPRQTFGNAGVWQRHFSGMVHCSDAIVFFASPEGVIGRKLYYAIKATYDAGKPVYYLTQQGRLVDYGHVCFNVIQRSFIEFARVAVKPILEQGLNLGDS